MITIRNRNERGGMQNEWLNAKYSFSFGRYQDPAHMGFGTLRVINEDVVAPGGGFATHPHENMEIVTYVLDGALEHKDSMGNGEVIRPGELQRMSAGTGVTHSEFNHSNDNEVHMLQIWFYPEVQDVKPGYEQQAFSDEDKQAQMKLAVSKDGRDGSMRINQDLDIYLSKLDGSDRIEFTPRADGVQWVQVARGALDLNGRTLQAGDGAAIQDEQTLVFDHAADAELLLFDMKHA